MSKNMNKDKFENDKQTFINKNIKEFTTGEYKEGV